MILTFDLGTSVTKATVWSADGPVAEGRADLATTRPEPGRVEQDPARWWESLVEAAAGARRADAWAWSAVEAIVFAAARETFVLVDADGRALGPGIVWSDRRAGAEAVALAAQAGGVGAFRDRTGVVLDAGAMVAKLSWLATNEPDLVAAARWALAPRDLIVCRLTGVVTTDATLASRTGCFERGQFSSDSPRGPTDGPAALSAPVRAPIDIAGPLLAEPAARLGLVAGMPVVIGAGDRACEVLGAGASAVTPMVSWGTTANVSVPAETLDGSAPAVGAVSVGAVSVGAVSVGALGGVLVECGLSAAGAAVSWLAALCGTSESVLYEAAVSSPPGARGVTATAWIGGARAPWWAPDARGSFAGLTSSHGRADMARALIEAIAFDVARCIELLDVAPVSIVAAGGGGAAEPWVSILAAVTGCAVEFRRAELAASAGALLVAGAALGRRFDLDTVNPVTGRREPDPSQVAAYREPRARSDKLAAALLGRSD